MKFKAILIVGMPGSGKDEFANVAREMGIEVINMGDVVREYTKKMGLDISQSGVVANEERRKFGMDIWAKRTIERVKSKFIVIEGIRNIEEIQRIKEEADIGLVIGISSGRIHRLKRLLERGRADDPKDEKEFEEREKRELNWGIGNVLATADYYICNEGSLEDFRMRVREFLMEHKVL